MPQRWLFADEAAKVLSDFHARSEPVPARGRVLSQQEAEQFHSEQRRRQQVEAARNAYYLNHRAGAPPFDESEVQI
jgi:hypothetical protein